MITTMTPALQAALAGKGRRPRQLLEINFPTSGTLYLSDQRLGVTDGLASEYQPLVEDWGSLADSSGGARSRDHGLIKECSITFWNGGNTPLSDHFIANPVETVEVLLYQWAMGLTEADKFLLDRFLIADPIDFDEASHLLTLDLLSLAYLWDMPIGGILLQVDWPYADPADIGKAIPMALGSPGQIPALKAKVAKRCTLGNSVLKNDLILPVNGDLNNLSFPPSGTVQLDEELITYSGRTANSFTGCVRGTAGTLAAQHLRNAELVEHLTDHTFLLCEPVASIANVLVDGYPAPAGSYTVNAAANPARVIFNTQPYYERFSSGSKFMEMQFDAVGVTNTAINGANAFDIDELATAAVVAVASPKLAIVQQSLNPDLGQILKAYLSVAHWEEGTINADYVLVAVTGAGVLGILSAPNPADQITLDGDVDLDHEHLHATGAAHTHSYIDPSIYNVYNDPYVAANDPPHPHTTNVGGPSIVDTGNLGLPYHIDTYTSTNQTKSMSVYFQVPVTGATGKQVHLRIQKYNVRLVRIHTGYTQLEWDATVGYIDQVITILPSKTSITIVYGTANYGSELRLDEITLTTTTDATITSSTSGVTAGVATPGSVITGIGTPGSVLGQGADYNDEPIKSSDDVQALVAENAPLNLNA